jgi:hypothetical protein
MTLQLLKSLKSTARKRNAFEMSKKVNLNRAFYNHAWRIVAPTVI